MSEYLLTPLSPYSLRLSQTSSVLTSTSENSLVLSDAAQARTMLSAPWRLPREPPLRHRICFAMMEDELPAIDEC